VCEKGAHRAKLLLGLFFQRNYEIKFNPDETATISLSATLPLPARPLSVQEALGGQLRPLTLVEIQQLLPQVLSEFLFGRGELAT
jgi:hypothetical protein